MLSVTFYLLLCWISLCWVSCFIYYYAEYQYAECCYAECRSAAKLVPWHLTFNGEFSMRHVFWLVNFVILWHFTPMPSPTHLDTHTNTHPHTHHTHNQKYTHTNTLTATHKTIESAVCQNFTITKSFIGTNGAIKCSKICLKLKICSKSFQVYNIFHLCKILKHACQKYRSKMGPLIHH